MSRLSAEVSRSIIDAWNKWFDRPVPTPEEHAAAIRAEESARLASYGFDGSRLRRRYWKKVVDR